MAIANLNYEDHSVTKKQRIDAQLASLKIKRRTKFQPIPIKRDSSKSVFKSPSKGSGRNSEMTFASPKVNTEYGQILKTEPVNSPVPEQRGSMTVAREDEADNLLEMTEQPKNEKFLIFRDKLEKIVTEQDYVSQSEDSEE